jgi:sugar transferase (PEP-CTERM/EpsH1 system associated)
MILTGRIRIVHLVSTLNMGGLEMFVWHLARHHDRAAFDFQVLSLGERGALGPRFDVLGVPAHSLDCAQRTKGATLVRLVARLRQLRPHVLHTHNPSPHVFGSLAARTLGIPVLVHTKHGRNRPHYRPAVLLNRLAACLSHCVVSVSHDSAAVARCIERVPAHKVRVIHNGIDLDSFAPEPRAVSGATLRAIHVARLSPIKDQRTLLQAVRRVVDAEPGFHLDIVGDGPMREELVTLCHELQLSEQVRFLGFREDVRELLATADCYVLSSVSEGVSLTLLEAMAMGLPVVATAVGGNPEVVAHGETGLVVPAGSPERLAEALLALIRHPNQARRMGQAGRQRVEEHFDLRRVVGQYEGLYRNLLAKKR